MEMEIFMSQAVMADILRKYLQTELCRFIDSTSNPNLKQTNGLAFYKDGNLFACDYGLGAILKISPDRKM
ncbi:MAG: hypothetical protein MZV64_38240 [Ignavibacteriales bacterium]|nr:hypothetical protein [Ignavibacteriales bacterium]